MKQKREIVKRFKAGEPMYYIAFSPGLNNSLEVEQAIRDFLNNKFSLKAKKREK